jgi:hypothetical protein
MVNQTATPPAEPSEVWIKELPREEQELLNVYRRAKRMGYADITISIQEGRRVKLWLTEKFK